MKDILKQFSLPSYLKGDSFAKDSKRITDKVRGKNKEYSSPEDIATEKELLGRLEAAQEHTKKMIEPREENPNAQVPMPQQQNFLGGLMGGDGAKGLLGKMGGMSAVGEGAAGLLGGLAEEGNGYKNEGLAGVAGALSGAAKGAEMGKLAGPLGMGIGAAGGAIVGGITSFTGAKDGNTEADKINSANTYTDSAKTSNFATGGNTEPCGGEGQPPCPQLGQEDLIKINTQQDAPLQFVQDESGVAAMNNLFQPAPPPIERAKVDYGRYGDVNYFEQDEADPTGLTLKAGKGQIHNEDAIKRQFKTIQGMNPGMKLQYNAMGGNINREVATGGKNIQNRFKDGGSTDPGKKRGSLYDEEGNIVEPGNVNQSIQSENYLNNPYDGVNKNDSTLKRAGAAIQHKWQSMFPFQQDGDDPSNEWQQKYYANYPGQENNIENKYRGLDTFDTSQSTRADDPYEDIGQQGVGKAHPAQGPAPTVPESSKPTTEPRNARTAIQGPDTRGVDMTGEGFQLQDLIQKNRIGVDRDVQAGVNTAGGLGANNLGPQAETGEEKGTNTVLENLMRSAPALANAYNLANLKKPDAESYGRLNKKYKQTKVDEQELQNQVREQMAGTREAILGSSGGSGSTARANLLGSQLRGSQALSGAYMQAQQANAQEAARAQQFDLGVAGTNLQQSNKETLANAQNKAGYENQKANLISAIGENVGGMGTEALFRKYPELMGMDYDAMGKYMKDKKKKKNKK